MKKLFAILIVVLVINAAFWFLPQTLTELQMEKGEVFSTSDATTQLMSQLDEKITAYHVVTVGNEDENLLTVLNSLALLSDDFSVLTIAPDSDAAKNLSSETLADNSIIIASSDRTRVINASDMLTFSDEQYALYSSDQSTQPDLFVGESLIAEAVDYVIKDNSYVAYIMASGDDDMDKELLDAYENNFADLKTLDLEVEKAVPEDAVCLMICLPTQDISSVESSVVKSYLASGGKLMVFTYCAAQETTSADGSSTYATVNTPNLDAILSAYGVSSSEGMIFDSNEENCCYYSYYGTYLQYMYKPELADSNFKDYSVYAYYAQPIVKAETLPEGVKVTDFVRAGSSTYLKADPYAVTGGNFEKAEGDTDGPFVTAVRISDSNTKAQIVWFASMIYDTETLSLDTDLTFDVVRNMAGVKNAGNTEDEPEFDSSEIQPMEISASSQQLELDEGVMSSWTVITAFVLPALALALGLIIAYVRKIKTSKVK